MKSPRIAYTVTKYPGHAAVAKSYCDIIARDFQIVQDLSQSDIVIVHHEPRKYKMVYDIHPILKHKYVIACCVWEATDLPDLYKESISHVQEIWTCSHYCQNVFERYHPTVSCIPCVVERDTVCRPSDVEFIHRMVGYNPSCFYYLSIARVSDRRKNVTSLVEAFKNHLRDVPGARLIIKGDPEELPSWEHDDRIIFLPIGLPASQINALYQLADVYVSTHHAEGWGLTLSDAMLFAKPVVATRYSGNLEFMNSANSFLIECEETAIRPEDCDDLWTPKMKWAYPSEDKSGRALRAAYDASESGSVHQRTANALKDVTRFSRENVGDLLVRRLRDIGDSL